MGGVIVPSFLGMRSPATRAENIFIMLSVGAYNRIYVSRALQDKPMHGFTPVGESLFFVVFDDAFPGEPIQSRPDEEPAFFWCWLAFRRALP